MKKNELRIIEEERQVRLVFDYGDGGIELVQNYLDARFGKYNWTVRSCGPKIKKGTVRCFKHVGRAVAYGNIDNKWEQ